MKLIAKNQKKKIAENLIIVIGMTISVIIQKMKKTGKVMKEIGTVKKKTGKMAMKLIAKNQKKKIAENLIIVIGMKKDVLL